MENLKTLLDRENLQPTDIAKETGISTEMLNNLLDGNLSIMDISLSTVLLLCQYIGVSITDLIGYTVVPERDWNITAEQYMYYLSFRIGSREFRLELCPATAANAKYIYSIARTYYEEFLHGIIENKGKKVEMESEEQARYEKFISDVTKRASIYLNPTAYAKDDWGTVRQRFDIQLMGIPLVTGLPLSGTAEIDIPWQMIDAARQEDDIVKGVLLSYRGFSAVARYDNEGKIYHGRIEDITDLVTFGGSTIEEAAEDFKAAVDDYLADAE